MTEAAAKLTDIKVMAIVSSLIFASLGSMAILTQQSTSTIEVYAQQSQTFTAKLSGKDEVPPVNTQATGTAQFQVSSDGKEINYDITTTNPNGLIEDISLISSYSLHIHKGKSGESGPPVAELQKNNFNMTSKELIIGPGKITSSDLQGPLAGKQISDLVDLMKNGKVYVNVQNQNDQIRGQVMSG